VQLFQGGGAPAAVKGAKAPDVKKPGEPIKLPSFGVDAGSIALPGETQHSPLHTAACMHHRVAPSRHRQIQVCPRSGTVTPEASASAALTKRAAEGDLEPGRHPISYKRGEVHIFKYHMSAQRLSWD
jgi:hypothetical protein